jgi:hypothetical protein
VCLALVLDVQHRMGFTRAITTPTSLTKRLPMEAKPLVRTYRTRRLRSNGVARSEDGGRCHGLI